MAFNSQDIENALCQGQMWVSDTSIRNDSNLGGIFRLLPHIIHASNYCTCN